MKIIIDNKIPFIKGRLESFAEVVYLDPGDIDAAAVRDADTLVIRTRTRCDGKLLAGSRVKTVVTATIGTDHIDLPWCRENGIEVRNCAGCNAPGVSQYVFTALYDTGFNPATDTLGIVGCGNVGSIVAEWALKNGIGTLVCDPPKAESGCIDREYVPFERLIREADAITLHVPLTHDGLHPTFHMVSENEMDAMKPGALLVNSSRGPVADNKAWEKAIRSGRIRGVADVWEGEPEISRGLLECVEFGTPHIAGYSLEGKQRATRMALEALEEIYGFHIDKAGLEGPYQPLASKPDMEGIARSYDIKADTESLRANPGNFEKLRGNYDFRREYKP